MWRPLASWEWVVTTLSSRYKVLLNLTFPHFLLHLSPQKGIMPDWEDYQNKWGGRWIIERADPTRHDDMDEYWLETLFMLIGEHITPAIFNNIVNGAVIQTKKTKFRLAIWLKVTSYTIFTSSSSSFIIPTFRRIPRINLPSPVLESISRKSSRFPRPSSLVSTPMVRLHRASGPAPLARTGSMFDPFQPSFVAQ